MCLDTWSNVSLILTLHFVLFLAVAWCLLTGSIQQICRRSVRLLHQPTGCSSDKGTNVKTKTKLDNTKILNWKNFLHFTNTFQYRPGDLQNDENENSKYILYKRLNPHLLSIESLMNWRPAFKRMSQHTAVLSELFLLLKTAAWINEKKICDP